LHFAAALMKQPWRHAENMCSSAFGINFFRIAEFCDGTSSSFSPDKIRAGGAIIKNEHLEIF
jgi:hypothetical protein